MDLHSVAQICLTFFEKFGIVFLCYWFPKSMIEVVRKDKDYGADLIEKILHHAAYLWIILVVSAFLNQKEGEFDINQSIAYCVVAYVPCLFGLRAGFRKDASLDMIERHQIRKEVEEVNRTSRDV